MTRAMRDHGFAQVFLNRYLTMIIFLTILMMCQCAELPQSQTLDNETTRWGNNNIVVLDSGARKTIEGMVCYIEGAPVEGALTEVYLDESVEGRKWEYSSKRIAVCKTKSNGRFKFDSLPVGKYEVRCSLNGYQTVSFVHVTIVSDEKSLNTEQLNVFMYVCD